MTASLTPALRDMLRRIAGATDRDGALLTIVITSESTRAENALGRLIAEGLAETCKHPHIERARGVRVTDAGRAALPAPIAPDDWRAVLGEHATLDAAEAVYRERIKTAHPDADCSHGQAAALNAAIAAARKGLTP